MKTSLLIASFSFSILFLAGCSSTPPVRSQEYATLQTQQILEFDFESVWKGIETALHDMKISDRDPVTVDPREWSKIQKRVLETDWIYSQSRDKYQEYSVNGFPKKQYLPIRVKYKVHAKRVMGGAEVSIDTQEEVERLKGDGTSAGFSKADHLDSSRPHELLEKIRGAVLSSHP